MATEFRVGQGWDNHRLATGRAMVLGGVRVDCEFGFEAHSDGDILLHALTDAVLGAIAAGDIGMHFPDTDPRWKGAPSEQFLKHACALAAQQGWRLVNADCTAILERPKLKDYRGRIRESVAGCLGLSLDRVNVKFKTSEKVGPVGEGRSAEAQAVVLLERDQPSSQS